MERLDFIIFGATGFTGKKAVEEAVQLCKEDATLTWGVAGRSQKKLKMLLEDVSRKTGENLQKITITIAEVENEHSLLSMCRQAKVVVNCCGPYRLYGEAVVRAAIESGTHYVDVSGEPQFMERMQLQYDASARAAGVYVISACGLESVPADVGTTYLQQHFDGTLNSVESLVSIIVPGRHIWRVMRSGFVNYGTWHTLVLGLANLSELKSIREKLYPQRLPKFEPTLKSRPILHKTQDGYSIPLPLIDSSVVYRTQRYMYEHGNKRPVQFKAYVGVPYLILALGLLIWVPFLYILCQFEFSRNLLLKYPRAFTAGVVSHEGPAEEVMNSSSFQTILFGKGWGKDDDVQSAPPKKKVVIKVTGINPGYGATVTALIWCALTVLKEHHKMPFTGGVLTPGAAFCGTDLVIKLHAHNFKFEVLTKN